MKMKLSFDKQAIQGFFLAHVEKIALVGVAALAILVLYNAFGQVGFSKTPGDLVKSADNTVAHVEQDRTGEVRKELSIEDYPAIARRNRIPVEEQYYVAAAPWDQPLSRQDARRPTPPVLPVRNLMAITDRGSFKKTTTGSQGSQTFGHRFVVVTGLVPIAEQAKQYSEAFNSSAYYDPKEDFPKILYFVVERAEVLPGQENTKPQFKEMTPVEYRQAYEQVREFSAQAEAFPEMAQDRTTFPLPQRSDKPWPDSIYPKELIGPSYAEVAAHPASFQGQSVLWRRETKAVEGRRAVCRYVSLWASRENAPPKGETSQFFAIDYPNANLAKQSEQATTAKAEVVGSATVPDPDHAGKTITVPLLKVNVDGAVVEPDNVPAATDPLLGLAGAGGGRGHGSFTGPGPMHPHGRGAGQGEAGGVEYALFRYIDFNVAPGCTYLYRVKLVFLNPNYNRKPYELVTPADAAKEVLSSSVSNTSDPLTIPADYHLLLTGNRTLRRGEAGWQIAVVKWLESTGAEAFQDYMLYRGSSLIFPDAKFPPTGPQAATVNYSTGGLLLDLRGTEVLPGRPHMNEVGEVLILGADGQMHVYSEFDGKPEFDRLKKALEATTPAAAPAAPAGPSFGEGALEFGM